MIKRYRAQVCHVSVAVSESRIGCIYHIRYLSAIFAEGACVGGRSRLRRFDSDPSLQ
jgi:hypothetical protein